MGSCSIHPTILILNEMKRFTITYPLLVVAALALAFDQNGWLVLYLTAAGLHELGHLAAIMLLGGRVRHITAGLGGMKIDYTTRRQSSYAADILTALAGPAANLILMALCAAAARLWPGEDLYYFCGVNLLLALFNLVPAAPLDGGRAVRALLFALIGPDRGERAARAVSLLAGWGLAAAGAALLCFTRRNGSLLFAALVVLQSLHSSPERKKDSRPA